MLEIYNTLTGKKETFKPKKGKKVNLFVCGPTVYDFSHIGHTRTYVIFDVIVKYLRSMGYNVFYLQNITDVDDKIIDHAKENNVSSLKWAKRFEKEYFKDMKSLKIDSVSKYARATDYIKEIISQVKRLIKKGYAYQLKDGIYYDISKFKNYGKLSRRTVIQAEDGVSRIDEAKDKRNKGDFCLWKFSKKGEPKWQSPWSWGRPGWHIEDTAITEKYFGPQYDIHGGARDLIFPHHEAEIAQMEAISGKKPLVRYWLHTGFLTVNGRKMAKSFGNFITIRDFLKKYSSRILRFLIIKNHYRSPIDYSEKLIYQTKNELERIDEFIDKLKNTKRKSKLKFKVSEFQKEFDVAMKDDFNTPKAMAVIFDLINKGNTLFDKDQLDVAYAKQILEFLKKIDNIFFFIFWKKSKEKIPQNVLDLIKRREKFRKEGLWQKADEIRKKIVQMGYQIEDTKKGPAIKKLYEGP
jgi:cysteinyl-tRNA synthetase